MKPLWRYMGKILPVLIVLFCFALGQTASAHAILLKASPGQESHLKTSPEKVTLTFNERLGNELYKLKVYDNDGKQVTDNKAKLSQKHRKLMLDLPHLDDGYYTVTYKVISADGHPVDSTYTFSVGHVSDSATAQNAGVSTGGHDHSVFGFVIRIAYFLALLFVTGWTIWGFVYRKASEAVRTNYRHVAKTLKTLYLLILLGFGFTELSSLLSGIGESNWTAIFTSSSVGITWLISLVLAILGFWVLGHSKWIDALWVAILLGAQAANGHAFAFHPKGITLTLDLFHLVGAAIWAGGLLYLIAFWKKHPDHIQGFLPVFSKMALISIIAIVVTGTIDAVLFLPEVSDVFLTWWGRLLLVKVFLVIVVVITAAFIRQAMKKQDMKSVRSRIQVDFTSMVLILAVAAVFTVFNPRPANEPLTWHQTKNHITMSTNITPKLPKTANTFTVKVNLPTRPNQVRMVIRDKSDNKASPIKIPLKATGHKGNTYVYETDKGFIPSPGKWEVTLRIIDQNDHFTKMQKDMTIYPTDL